MLLLYAMPLGAAICNALQALTKAGLVKYPVLLGVAVAQCTSQHSISASVKCRLQVISECSFAEAPEPDTCHCGNMTI